MTAPCVQISVAQSQRPAIRRDCRIGHTGVNLVAQRVPQQPQQSPVGARLMADSAWGGAVHSAMRARVAPLEAAAAATAAAAAAAEGDTAAAGGAAERAPEVAQCIPRALRLCLSCKAAT